MALSDLIQANDIMVGPNQILREVSLISFGKAVGRPETIVPVKFTLANSGPEADTYTLTVTDTAGWTLSQLPSSLEIKGLSKVELVLNVTLPGVFRTTVALLNRVSQLVYLT